MIITGKPFRVPYRQTQGFKEGFHRGLDWVPLNNGVGFPADIYPIVEGTIRYSYTELNGKKSVQIAVQTVLDAEFIQYLKALGDIPLDFTGEVRLLTYYLHGLSLYEDTPGKKLSIHDKIMVCGNTGQVYSNGVTVPEEEKGVPPYRGLHLHLQCELYNSSNRMIALIDPNHVMDFKPKSMIGYKQVNDSTVYVALGSVLVAVADWDAFVQVGGSESSIIELDPISWSKFSIADKVLFKLNA